MEQVCGKKIRYEYPHDPGDFLEHECILLSNHEGNHKCICWHTWKDEK